MDSTNHSQEDTISVPRVAMFLSTYSSGYIVEAELYKISQSWQTYWAFTTALAEF